MPTGYMQRKKMRQYARRHNATQAASADTHDRRQPPDRGLISVHFPLRSRPGGGGDQPAVPSGVDLHAGDVRGTLGDGNIPTLNKGKISGAGTWADSDIPTLNKGKISGAGTWADSDIPNLDAGKINGGQFHPDRIPGLSGPEGSDNGRVYSRKDADAKFTVKGHGHGWNDINNPPQSADQDKESLRKIAGSGSSKRAAASDHSHGSGNTLDVDYLPEAVVEDIVRVRKALVEGIDTAKPAPPSRQEFEQLRYLVLALAAVLFDAPDLTLEERLAKRKAGEHYAEFFEFRRFDEVGDIDNHYHDRELSNYANPRAELLKAPL